MTIRKIYVHPDDLIEICIVVDKDVKPCKSEFDSQGFRIARPIQLTVKNNTTICFSDPSYQFGLESFNGVIKRWLQ